MPNRRFDWHDHIKQVEGEHRAVRRLRNYWAHEDANEPASLTLAEARARLQQFLSWLPNEWD